MRLSPLRHPRLAARERAWDTAADGASRPPGRVRHRSRPTLALAQARVRLRRRDRGRAPDDLPVLPPALLHRRRPARAVARRAREDDRTGVGRRERPDHRLPLRPDADPARPPSPVPARGGDAARVELRAALVAAGGPRFDGELRLAGAGLRVLDTCFTLYATPYLALGAEMSEDYHERTELSAWRAFFHVIGLFVGGVVPGLVVGCTRATRTGYAMMGIRSARHDDRRPDHRRSDVRRAPRRPAMSRPWAWRAFVRRSSARRSATGPSASWSPPSRVILIGGGMHQMLVPYVFRYWLGRPELEP